MSQNKIYKLKVTCKQEGIEHISKPARRSTEEVEQILEAIKTFHKKEANYFEMEVETGFITIPGDILSKCIFELIEVKNDD
jgi:hypothetical protein